MLLVIHAIRPPNKLQEESAEKSRRVLLGYRKSAESFAS